jgi:hypothetical protein
METYKRSTFNLVRSILIAPFTGIVAYIIAQVFLPERVSFFLGMAAGAVLLYMAFFSENIRFELDDDGVFRYVKRGRLENSFALGSCKIGYRRKSQSGILGNNDINLKILDGEGKETDLDASPIGTDQFMGMFEKMEKYAIKDEEPITAE